MKIIRNISITLLFILLIIETLVNGLFHEPNIKKGVVESIEASRGRQEVCALVRFNESIEVVKGDFVSKIYEGDTLYFKYEPAHSFLLFFTINDKYFDANKDSLSLVQEL